MTIPIEVLRRVSCVYTHKNCPDGMATAMVLVDAFRMLGMNPAIQFLAHGTPEHVAAHPVNHREDRVLFCDIAPHPASVELCRGRTVVLDHHKGVEELVRSFGELGVFADEKLEPGVSGAVLAFREVWEPVWLSVRSRAGLRSSTAEFVESIGARDTWQTSDPRFMQGQWASKMLMSKPASWWLGGYEASSFDFTHSPPGSIRRPMPCLTQEEVQVGRALFEAHEEAVRQAVDQCVCLEMPEGQEKCVLLYVFQEQASGFRLTSDVAEAIRSGTDNGPGVVAGFSYVVDKPGGDPKLLYSLRGLNGFDVAGFAKANGGGGHTAAAGFSVPIRHRSGGATNLDPYLEIYKRLVEHLP